MQNEIDFPMAEGASLDPPRVSKPDRDLRVGDDVRIVSGGRPVWATIAAALTDSTYVALVSSIAPCDAPLRSGMRAIVRAEDVWLAHAPGSHPRFVDYVRKANARQRSSPSRDALCESPLDPCYLHEPELAEGFEDVRGCWRCGADGPRAVRCDMCSVAAYCSKACRIADAFAHQKPCRYWCNRK